MNKIALVKLSKLLLASLIFTTGGTLIRCLYAAEPGSADAFLDRPLPADLALEIVSAPAPTGDGSTRDFPALRVHSLWAGVQQLGTMSGKTVRLPEELAKWPDERTEDNLRFSLGIPQDGKVRELFEHLCESLDLAWHYDAQLGVINLEPAWKRAAPRPGKELVGVLLDNRPVRLDEMETSRETNRVGGHSLLPDAWRLAFDELLSRPENFPLAGAVRLYHDSHGHHTMLFFVENVLATRLLDADGHPWVIVLNKQESMSNKEDPGDLAYYLFDEDGRFMQGGVYAIAPGREGAITQAEVERGRIITVMFGQGSFASQPVGLRFALVKDGLVLQGSIDSKGVQRNAQDTQHLPDEPPGETTYLKYSVRVKPNP